MGVGNSEVKSTCPEQRLGCFDSRRNDFTLEVRRKSQKIRHPPLLLMGEERQSSLVVFKNKAHTELSFTCLKVDWD